MHLRRLLPLIVLTQASAFASVEVVPYQNETPSQAASIHWMDTTPENIDSGKTFTISGENLSAAGTVIATSEKLVLVVDVTEPEQANAQSEGDIWNGDAIQIAIDAHSDGVREASNKETEGPLGPDDYAIALALTDNGQVGWVHYATSEEKRGSLNSEFYTVSRDDTANITHYRLELPWSWLATTPGVTSTLGLAVQVNDGAEDAQQRIYWGRGADGAPRPALHKTLQFDKAPTTVAGFLVRKEAMWRPGQMAEGLLALKGADQSARILDASGKVVREIKGTDQLQRFMVRANEATTIDLGEKTVKLEPVSAKKLASELVDLLEKRLVDAEPQLFRRHLKSVRTIVLHEYSQLDLLRKEDPPRADAVLEMLRNLHRGFKKGDAGDWQAYLDGRRSLVMAYISPSDENLSCYSLALPKPWNKDEAYPVFLELHGAGQELMLGLIADRLGLPEDADPENYDAPSTAAERARKGYWIHPWGRGNTRYRGIGETDVWEAYEDAKAMFNFDEDRHYLYGFSMGGGGTWSLGMRTPDRWAAITVFAGGLWSENPNVSLAQNANDLPIYMWVGEEDFLYESMQEMRSQLEEADANLKNFETIPEIGHNYQAYAQDKYYEKMLQHTRQRPDEFSFVVDTPEHRGLWGVRVRRDLSIAGLQRIHVKIDEASHKVTIETEGTDAAKVRMGEDGLQLADGEWTINWNGTDVYTGEPDYLILKDGKSEVLPPDGPTSPWNPTW